ncbi:MAG TPA: TonB-dependent receptor [Bacteroidales bacterium]|nr:TonB-dependent receptor [Bacteroidales bacterium]
MKQLKSIVSRIIIALLLLSGARSYGQQNITITGNVVDNNNVTIEGATVSYSVSGKIAGGSLTDKNGNFKLSAPAGSILKVSFIGYTTYEDTISAAKNTYSVILKEELQSLDEVVVVGYGTQKRSELTGSISSVSAKEVKDFSSKSLAESLSGLAAGVQVTKSDGMPGGASDIIIRGAGSLNGMAPLYVVDGVPQEAGFSFNMRDVASVEILKDAGSAAIYGSRAAGGVILITTHKGKSGEKTTINANGRFGIRRIYTNIELLDTKEWIRARDAFGTTNTLDILGVSNIQDLPNTNWMDVMFGSGTEQEYNFSVTSGSESTNFFLSAGYLGEKGVYLDTRADRYSFRNNIEHKFNKHLTIGESVYGSSVKTNPAISSSIYNHTIPFRTVPVSQVYDTDGNFAMTNAKVGSGPNFVALEDAFHVFNDNNYSLNAQAFMNIHFIEGLDLKITGSGEFMGFSKNTFTEYRDFGPVEVSPQRLEAYAGTLQNLMFNSVFTYEKKFNNHSLKLMAGAEYWKLDGYNLGVTAYKFSIPVAQSIALSSAGPTKDAYDNIPIERRGSFFGRINYSYLDKYLLTANFRSDASDRFVGKNRWGYFPSVNVGWKLSDEEFMKDLTGSWLEYAKIRGSWGLLGNDASVPQFMYASTWSGTGISHSFDGTSTQQSGYWLAVFGNRNLKWEEIEQVDAGLDLYFLDNRLSFTYDYYNRQTKDMLYRGDLPLSGGMSYYFSSDDPANTVPVYFNAGLVVNQGHEISLGWKNKKGKFSYSINANASFNSNLVKQVGDQPGATPIDEGLDNTWSLLSRTQDGHAMSLFYGYKSLGIFQSQEQVDEYNLKALNAWKAQNPGHTSFDPITGQPLNADGQPIGIYYQKMQTGVGDLIFDDKGQGRVTPTSRQFIGNPWPKMTFGMNINLEYKNVDLSAVFQGAFGFDIMNLVKPYTQMFSSDNTTADIFKTSCFGKDNNKVTDYPRVGFVDENGSFIADGAANKNYSTVSSYMVEKGDYLKLKNLSFGYTLPAGISQKAGVQKVRVYVTVQNVFTITGYTGIDPEIGGNVLMRGVDHQNRYLPSRLMSVGLDLTL